MSGAGITEPDKVKAKPKAAVVRIRKDPEVTSRPWESGDPQLPRNANSTIVAANSHGWNVNITYARGFSVTGIRTHSIVVRVVRESQRAVGVWHAKDSQPTTWSYDYGAVLGEWILGRKDGTLDRQPFSFPLASDELKWLLTGPLLTRTIITDRQHEALGGHPACMPESEFRAMMALKPRKQKKGEME